MVKANSECIRQLVIDSPDAPPPPGEPYVPSAHRAMTSVRVITRSKCVRIPAIPAISGLFDLWVIPDDQYTGGDVGKSACCRQWTLPLLPPRMPFSDINHIQLRMPRLYHDLFSYHSVAQIQTVVFIAVQFVCT